MKEVYSDEQKAHLAKLWADGLTYDAIAARLNWSRSQVKYLRAALNLPARINRSRAASDFWTEHRDEVLRRMWEDQRPALVIADAIGALPGSSESVRRQKIYNRAKELKLPARGKDFAKNKGWSPAKIQEACDLYVAGHSINKIAMSLNRSPGVVERVLEKRGLLNEAPSPPSPDVPPAFKPPGTPIRLPYRATATPKPDLADWQKRRDAMQRRLETDGGNLTTERKIAQ